MFITQTTYGEDSLLGWVFSRVLMCAYLPWFPWYPRGNTKLFCACAAGFYCHPSRQTLQPLSLGFFQSCFCHQSSCSTNSWNSPHMTQRWKWSPSALYHRKAWRITLLSDDSLHSRSSLFSLLISGFLLYMRWRRMTSYGDKLIWSYSLRL